MRCLFFGRSSGAGCGSRVGFSPPVRIGGLKPTLPLARTSLLCFVVVATLGRLAITQETALPTVANVPHCFVTLADQADLPPQEAGVIQEIAGTGPVAEKQLLLQLDDRKAQREQDVAEAKYEAANDKAKDDINIRYAVAAAEVAQAEYKMNLDANAAVPGSVPKAKINELKLKCKETELAIEKANLDRTVAAAEAKVAKAEVEAAKVMVDRHKVLSPVSGAVVDVRAHKGEAVQPTQAVIHVVKLDSVWVEGNVPAAKFARAELERRPVTVDVVITRGEKVSLPGKVTFVKPLTDTGDTFLVRATVDNRKVNGSWQLSPGMQAEMNIQLK